MSNPTDSAECTAQQAYEWSEGRAIFASGSPFEPVEIEGQCLTPGQANNVYVFPGIGRGAIVSGARRLPDEAFTAAAQALADSVSADDLEAGKVYPSLTDIRSVSLAVADAVAAALNRMDPQVKSTASTDRAEPYTEIYEPRY